MTRFIQDNRFFADVLVHTKEAHRWLWSATPDLKKLYVKLKKILSCPVFTKSKCITIFTSNQSSTRIILHPARGTEQWSSLTDICLTY